MWIRTQDGHAVINTNNVCDIFVVGDGTVKVTTMTDETYVIAEYDNKDMAKAAIEAVLRKEQYPAGFFDMPAAEKMRSIRNANRRLYDISIDKETK